MGNGVFHTAGKDVGQFPGALFAGGGHRQFRRLAAALPFEGADLDSLAAQFLAQPRHVDLIAIFAHQVNHIHSHNHRDTQLDELGGQVEVALDVGAVDDVEDSVGFFPHQVAPGHHLLQCVGGEGVDARQVLDHHVVVAFQAAFLLFHRNAGPVAHILVGAGQVIEQRGLAAVRVAGQCDFDCHLPYPFLSLNLYHGSVRLADAQLIAAHRQFQRIPQGRHFAQVDLGTLGQAHIHDAPPHRTFAVQPDHRGVLAHFQFLQCFHNSTSP